MEYVFIKDGVTTGWPGDVIALLWSCDIVVTCSATVTYDVT